MTARPESFFGAERRLLPRPRLDRRYSRFVALAKRIFPAVALALVLLIVAWPGLRDAFERVPFTAPRLDLHQADDLRMLEPRYSGIDRERRPFFVTAAAARQNPNAADIVALDKPKGDLVTLSGHRFRVIGDSGLYQPQAQLLDLFGNVRLFHDAGDEFVTESARIDLAHGTAEGHQRVEGHGPFGHIESDGFRTLNSGDDIVFTGHAVLDLTPHQTAPTKEAAR